MTAAPSPALRRRISWRPDQVNDRRSLWLAACGAVIGLVVAGFGLFTAQGTRRAAVPPQAVAMVNQTPILRSDYLSQLRALYDVGFDQASVSQRRQVLNDMLREELYVQRGIELGMAADDTDVRKALVGATEGQAVQEAASLEPDEATLRAALSAEKDRYAAQGSLAVDEWRIPPGRADQAPQIVAALRAGSAPPALGLIPTGRVKDLEFYWAAKLHLGSILFAAVEALPPGAISAPVVQADGVHIMVVRQNIRPVAARFEDVRPEVLARYRQTRAEAIKSGVDRFLRQRADVKIAADLR